MASLSLFSYLEHGQARSAREFDGVPLSQAERVLTAAGRKENKEKGKDLDTSCYCLLDLPHHSWTAAQIEGELHKTIVQIQSYEVATLLWTRVEYKAVGLLRLQYHLQLQPDERAVAQRCIAQKRGTIEGGHLLKKGRR